MGGQACLTHAETCGLVRSLWAAKVPQIAQTVCVLFYIVCVTQLASMHACLTCLRALFAHPVRVEAVLAGIIVQEILDRPQV